MRVPDQGLGGEIDVFADRGRQGKDVFLGDDGGFGAVEGEKGNYGCEAAG